MTTISHIGVHRVTKLFGSQRALHDVTFELSSGEVMAVMGANGAGKSTLLSLLSLRMKVTRGEVRFNGTRVSGSVEELRRRIGLLSHEAMVYADLSAKENLMFFAKLNGLRAPRAAVDGIIERLDLSGFAEVRPARVLSRGQLQRVALARALIAGPDLLLLDEPATGLDSAAVARIEKIVTELKGAGKMAVLVTHDPDVACRMATRALMLNRGSIVAAVDAPRDRDSWRQLYFDTVEGKR